MRDVEVSLPGDPHELYKLLMRGASTLWPVEAAERLIFHTESLRQWLVENNFIRACVFDERVAASTHFDEALAAWDRRPNAQSSEYSSDYAVLRCAASLAGKLRIDLRSTLEYLDERSAKLVAEAVMYAAGFMDGEANPVANDGPHGQSGPNWADHERRIVRAD